MARSGVVNLISDATTNDAATLRIVQSCHFGCSHVRGTFKNDRLVWRFAELGLKGSGLTDSTSRHCVFEVKLYRKSVRFCRYVQRDRPDIIVRELDLCV